MFHHASKKDIELLVFKTLIFRLQAFTESDHYDSLGEKEPDEWLEELTDKALKDFEFAVNRPLDDQETAYIKQYMKIQYGNIYAAMEKHRTNYRDQFDWGGEDC